MSRALFGIIASTKRPPSATISLSNPALSSYSPALTYYYSDADRDANVKRNVDWTVNVSADTILNTGSPTLQVRIYTASDNVLRATQNVTPVNGSNTGTFTGRSVNAAHYVQITLTDSFGQVFTAQSSNITTTDYEYSNVTYSASNAETYYETAWKNPNTDVATVRTSGTISGGADNAFDNSTGTSWTVTGVTGGTWVGVYGKSSYSEEAAATEMGKPVVSSTASGTGLVADSTQFFVSGIRYRISQRTWTRFYVSDDFTGNFLTSASFPREGTTENINLNDYDSAAYIENASDVSAQLPFTNNTYFEIPYTSSTVNGFADYNVKLALTEWYFLGVARVVNYGIHILQRNASTFNSWVTDCQAKLRVEYTARRVR